MHSEQPSAGGEKLASALASKGWSQQQLEEKLGVSKGVVSRWLSGSRRPSLEHALAMELLLKVPPKAWLIDAASSVDA